MKFLRMFFMWFLVTISITMFPILISRTTRTVEFDEPLWELVQYPLALSLIFTLVIIMSLWKESK